MRALILALALLAGGTALARKPAEFVPRDVSQQELDAARERSKNKIDFYDRDLPKDTRPFPWRAVALMGMAMLVVAPFAIRSYLRTSKELTGGKAPGAIRSDLEE